MCAEDVLSASTNETRVGKNYWKDRKESVYLLVARTLCRAYAAAPASVLDVGSHGTGTLEWHRRPDTKLVSVDLVRPYRGP